MINKAQLKKLINRAGKEGRLLWAYKDGVHYICDKFFMIKAPDSVFDSELVGLMYKYFNMKPKSGDQIYYNIVESERDKVTRKEKPVYKAEVHKTRDINFFIEGTEIKGEYGLVHFLDAFIAHKSGEVALYGEWDKETNRVTAIDRIYHELLAWNKPDITVPCTQYYKGKLGGIMFHEVNTDTVLWILPVRALRPKTLGSEYVMENE